MNSFFIKCKYEDVNINVIFELFILINYEIK